MTRSKRPGSVSRMSPTPLMPALLKRTSMRLSRRATRPASEMVSGSTVTSMCSALARPPALRIDATVERAPRSSTSATITCAPSEANKSALARPMPEPAPVIKQTLPSSLPTSALRGLSSDQLGQAEREQDDRPVDRIDPGRADVGQGEDVRDERQQDDARQCAHHPPPASLQRDAADDGGREDPEDQVRALTGGHRGHAARLHQAADRSQDAGDHEDADPDAVDLDAGSPRRLEVAADRVHCSADAVVAHEKRRHDEGGDRDPDRHRYSKPRLGADVT